MNLISVDVGVSIHEIEVEKDIDYNMQGNSLNTPFLY